MSLETRIENLETKVERLADVIEKLTEVLAGNNPLNPSDNAAKKPTKAKKTKAKLETVEPQPVETELTAEDVRNALLELSKSQGRQAAKDILAEFDAAKLGDVKKSDYAALIEVTKKYQKEAA